MRRLVEWAASKLQNPRIISDRNGTSPYLSRFYIIGAPKMPDGSSPFEVGGAPKPDAVWPNKELGVYLHHFHRGDDERELHNHPWRWAFSIILAGGYIEERRGKDNVVRSRIVRPGTINIIRSTDFHRVDLLDGDAWSLFVAGPKFKGWGFWNRDTNVFLPWRQFINELRGPTVFARVS